MGRTNALVRCWMGLPFVAGLILAGIANCNNGNTGDNGVGGTCRDLMTVFCHKAAQCDPVGLRRDFGNEQGCVERQSLACGALSLPGTGWTSSKIEQCAAQIANAPTCYGREAETGACGNVPGMWGGGTACELSSQCSSSQCSKSSQPLPDGGRLYLACGVCTSDDAGPGGCGTGPKCPENQRCVYDQTTSMCVTPQPEGAACATAAPCASPFFCKRASADGGTPGVCVKRGGKGVTCTSSSECDIQAGLRCVSAVCDTPIFVALGETVTTSVGNANRVHVVFRRARPSWVHVSRWSRTAALATPRQGSSAVLPQTAPRAPARCPGPRSASSGPQPASAFHCARFVHARADLVLIGAT